MGYSFRLAARGILYVPSHRQDSTYHGLCYTSRGSLAGTRNSSMGPPYEGSIRRPIASWAKALTTELHLLGTREYKQSDRGRYRAEGVWGVMEFGMSCRIKPKEKYVCISMKEVWRDLDGPSKNKELYMTTQGRLDSNCVYTRGEVSTHRLRPAVPLFIMLSFSSIFRIMLSTVPPLATLQVPVSSFQMVRPAELMKSPFVLLFGG